RHVKWGKLFRSGELAGLTEQGKQQFKALGLNPIVDYRTNSEVQAKPDPAIEGSNEFITLYSDLDNPN
ncbi:tyrosine-protein phosphatase, partial [Paenibacillus sp. 1001270B_150601_E10]|uniref:tyrosine-protein phosphatase n=1 Tax=Paenibacillus sp. 1001270B_150601_E10 TaxID=2787079 RepID=UPI0018A0D27A